METPVKRIASAVLLTLVMAVPACSDTADDLRRGVEAEQAGKRDEALAAYTRAIEAGDLPRDLLAFAYSRRGGVKGYRGDNASAVGDYTKSLELDPKLGSAYSLRGYLHGVRGQYDLAEKDHLAAIELAKGQKWDGYEPWVLQHYADLWRRRGEYDKALAFCDKAEKAGAYPGVHFRRAWVYLDMDRAADAKAEFATFEQEMARQKASYDVFWPDERDAIKKLRQLR